MTKSENYTFRLNPGIDRDKLVIDVLDAWQAQDEQLTVKEIVIRLVLAHQNIEMPQAANETLLAKAVRQQAKQLEEMMQMLKELRTQNPGALAAFANQGLPNVNVQTPVDDIDSAMLEALKKAKRPGFKRS